MCIVGKALRLRRIFNRRSNRAFIVALDHGVRFGPLKGIEDPTLPVKIAREGGADGVMATPAVARIVYGELGGLALIARVDGAATVVGPDITDDDLIASVKEAVALGADGVVAFGYVGVEKEKLSLRKLSSVASECLEYGMPLVAEMIPGELSSRHYAKARGEWRIDVDNLKLAVRVGVELGADVIKTYYTGDKNSFKEVVKASPIPILVLGGPPVRGLEGFLSMIRDALDAGAKGAIVGRNVWQHTDPVAVAKAVSALIHEDASVDEALERLRER